MESWQTIFFIFPNLRHYAAPFQNPCGPYVDKQVMEFCDLVMEKSLKSHGILSRKFRGNPGYAIKLQYDSK